MHTYGGWPDERFADVERASYFIGGWLRRWARVSVFQCKEKFGTVRVYLTFGWSTFYQIFYPGYMYVKPWWPYKLDLAISFWLMPVLNRIIVPVQENLYARRYRTAVRKWPYLYEEIVCSADAGELFDGIVPGYKHSDYWTQVDPGEGRL